VVIDKNLAFAWVYSAKEELELKLIRGCEPLTKSEAELLKHDLEVSYGVFENTKDIK
jgi:hypothetical protein